MSNRMRGMVPRFVSLVALMAMSSQALAALVTVDAWTNSSTGGVGANAGSFSAGQAFTVTVDPNDLWSAGSLPRWSNANGLVGDLIATGTDESHELAGTIIGQNLWGNWTQGGLSAPYGALVGRFGGAAGTFFLIGTSFSGTAGQGGLGSGLLELFYFDSNNGDNSEFVTANVSAVPIPAAGWLLLSGIGGFLAIARRRPGIGG